MAFKAEELTSKIFPESGTGLWAVCPQDTMDKGGKCPDNTKKPAPPPGPGPGCGATAPGGGGPKPHRAGELDRDALVLLQGQLRNRLAEGPAAARI
jgi:hypothetical protein